MVLCSETPLDKTDHNFLDNAKAKTDGNDSGFITYSNKMNFYGKWLYNSGYLINQWQKKLK